MTRCAIEGCKNGGQITRGWCAKHYTRWRRHGDPLHVDQPGYAGWPIEALLDHVDKNGPGGCWLWTGRLNNRGYAKAGHHYAHRLIYERLVGPIPEGLEIDHVHERGCRHRHCVNPAHLEPVTPSVNQQRQAAVNRKDRCRRGHLLDGDNVYVDPSGQRTCLTCRRANDRARYARRRAAQMEQAA